MTVGPEQRERLLGYYDGFSQWLTPAVESLCDDVDDVVEKARAIFSKMLDDLPYVAEPRHTMALAVSSCAVILAVFEVLRVRGIDAHAWGGAVNRLPVIAPEETADGREQARIDAAASQSGSAANEFVFEVIEAGEGFDRGMNITSCAICHLYGRYDAMALVPYMCAIDDRVSDAGDQGLRRTGTIALGAERCDFRFRAGGEPLPLADQYPEEIKV